MVIDDLHTHTCTCTWVILASHGPIKGFDRRNPFIGKDNGLSFPLLTGYLNDTGLKSGTVEEWQEAGKSIMWPRGCVFSLMMCTHTFATISPNPSQTHSLYLPNANVLLHSREGKTCRQSYCFPPLSYTCMHMLVHAHIHTAHCFVVLKEGAVFTTGDIFLFNSQYCDASDCRLLFAEQHKENKTEKKYWLVD